MSLVLHRLHLIDSPVQHCPAIICCRFLRFNCSARSLQNWIENSRPHTPIGARGIWSSQIVRVHLSVSVISWMIMNGGILMKFVTVNHYQVHLTLMTLTRSLGQRGQVQPARSWKSCERDSSWTTEGIWNKTFTQASPAVGPQTG